MLQQRVVVGVFVGEAVTKDGVARKAERRNGHWLAAHAVVGGLVNDRVARAATDVDRHITAAGHFGAAVIVGGRKALGVGTQSVTIGTDIGVEQLYPGALQRVAVGAAHAHGIEIDNLGAAQVGILKQRFSFDEQGELAQECPCQLGVALPLEVGRHVIAVEIASFIQERDVHVAEQVAAHTAVLVAGKCGTQRETVHAVDVQRGDKHLL